MFDVDFIIETETSYLVMLIVRLTLLDEIVRAQSIDPLSRWTVHDLIVDNLDDCPIEWTVGEDGGLWLGSQMYVPNFGDLWRRVMDNAERSKFYIYLGCTKMHEDMQRVFWWPQMKTDVNDYVSRCAIVSVRTEYQWPSGLYQP